ncbi:MAG: hypothetical protein WA667_18165 [Candidatus Nitrosopolaris sp.]
MVALGTLGGLILHFTQTHTNSPRIAAAEAKLEGLNKDIMNVSNQLEQSKPLIARAAGIITALYPQMGQLHMSHKSR